MNDAALLLIDIQNDYFPGGAMELEGALVALDRASELLRLFRERGRPVVHVRHLSTRLGATFFLPGTAGAEIHPRLTPEAGETIIDKHFPNSFRGTELDARLREAGVLRLVICGMMSHMCVDSTVRAAFDLGYSCTLIHDACATRALAFGEAKVAAADVHRAFMAALSGIFAEPVGARDFMKSIDREGE